MKSFDIILYFLSLNFCLEKKYFESLIIKGKKQTFSCLTFSFRKMIFYNFNHHQKHVFSLYSYLNMKNYPYLRHGTDPLPLFTDFPIIINSFQTRMNLIIIAFLLITCFSLNCNIYDYSKSKVTCALACPSGTSQINNFCLNSNQYISKSQVFTCGGVVSTDRTLCCAADQYLEGGSCLDCHGQVYSNGLACCPNDHYLDYSQGTPSCVQVQTGNCPSITYSSPFKICCPSQQLYNIATGTCAASFSLSCDTTLLACCPNGQMLEYSEEKYVCTSTCSWKSSANLLCQGKYCNTQQSVVSSGPNEFLTTFLSLNGKCCVGLDSSQNCITNSSNCISTFANRGWSICCPSGQFYVVSNATCVSDCSIGYVLLNFFCVSQGQGIDMRGILGQPTEMSLSGDCNGGALPSQMPVCCPSGFYIKGKQGCTICNGNIFLNLDTHVCCPAGYFFNTTSGECGFCSGTLDAAKTICCQAGTYVHYDQAGNPSCIQSCSTDNLYLSAYCCDSLSAGCSTTYTATTCSYSYFIPNSCKGCPSFCSSNSQTCTSSYSTNSCSLPCLTSQISISGVGCVKCDPSCVGCTIPMSSSSCLSCAEGYTLIGNTCQSCGISCRTCSQSTDLCTSCFRQANYTLINGKCYGRCSNSGYYLSPASLTCVQCASQCYECSSAASNCTMCVSSYYLSGASCQACSIYCLTCYSSASNCMICNSGSYKTPSGTCVNQCLDTTYSIYIKNTLCLPCHHECLGCTGHPENCISCSFNTTYLDDSLGINICTQCKSPCSTCSSLTLCTSCVNGYYLQYSTCIKCDSSCLTCNGPSNSNCLSCYGTSSLTSDGFCSGCSSTCNQCSGNLCSGCVAGYYIYNGNCLSSCPTGTYVNATVCTSCDSTCAKCNISACFSCNSGFLYVLGSKCYNNCPSGYIPNSGACIKTTVNNNTNNTNSSNGGNNSNNGNNSKNQTTLTQVGSIVDQTVLIQGKTAYINVYFSNNDALSNNITVNLINKNNGDIIRLTPSSGVDISDGKISFSVALPSGSDLSAYSLLQTSSTSPNGTTSTLVSSQSSNQLLLNDLQSNVFSNMKVLSYIFSVVVLLFSLLSKTKGHFTAEEANNIILHSLNFAQLCYLFKFATTLSEGGYFFLNGFGIANLTFFPNFFQPPDYYVETPVEKSLVPDGNFLRNAGCSISYQLVMLGVLLVAVIISFIVQNVRKLEEPPQIRKIMRLGALLVGLGFMNELFFAFVQLIQPASVPPDYPQFHSASMALSFVVIFLVPVLMIGTIFHFYQTYNSDVLEHYYTLREASHFLLTYAQALVMALGVGKPLIGLFLIALEWLWFAFNFMLYKYGSGAQLSGYKKYWGISGAISVGLLFLSVQWGIGWVAMVVLVSLSMVVLLVYCTYQVVGIYYYNIFTAEKGEHEN